MSVRTSLKNRNGFTIVELLVVIVVIGILASITIVSYSGISQKAIVSALQSDLQNTSTQLKMYRVIYGSYPTTLENNCPLLPAQDTAYCLKSSPNNTYSDYVSNGSTFSIKETHTNGTVYYINENSIPEKFVESLYQGWADYPDSPLLTSAYPYQFTLHSSNLYGADSSIVWLILSPNPVWYDPANANIYCEPTGTMQVYKLVDNNWTFVRTFISSGTPQIQSPYTFLQLNSPIYTSSALTTILHDK